MGIKDDELIREIVEQDVLWGEEIATRIRHVIELIQIHPKAVIC